MIHPPIGILPRYQDRAHPGRIVGQGTHDDLMALKGEYYRLYASQFERGEGGGVSRDLHPSVLRVPRPATCHRSRTACPRFHMLIRSLSIPTRAAAQSPGICVYIMFIQILTCVLSS